MPAFNFPKVSVTILLCLLLCACSSRKKLVYFNSPEDISAAAGAKNYAPVFRTDDLLSISVMGMDPASVKPFNLQGTSVESADGSSDKNLGLTYLIDASGMIDFPVIGRMKLAGLDRAAATNLIKEKVQQYVPGAMVNIHILNFKITILGEVKNPGTYTIPNERITLPEALGLAGDLNITGRRSNVLVIRDVDGKKTETRIDLTTKELFSSPVYYLSQNDIIYVEPNKAKINSSAINASNISIFVAMTSLLITLATLLTRAK